MLTHTHVYVMDLGLLKIQDVWDRHVPTALLKIGNQQGPFRKRLKKNYMAQWERIHLQWRRHRFNPQVRKIPWRRAWQSTPVFLPGESYGQKSLATVHGITKSRTWLSTHTHLDPVWGQPDFKSSLMSWSCASWKRISRHEAEWEENSLLEQKTLLEQWAGSRESWGFCG